ncbi:MAG: cytochrome c3 family protein [Ignavibacteria bacterium]
MKKIILIIVPFLLISLLIASGSLFGTKIQLPVEKEKTVRQDKKNSNTKIRMPEDHSKQGIKCTTCHEGEYPTKNDPMLRACLRESVLSEFNYVGEGPGEILIDGMSENYGGVRFSHKVHAQMSAMSTGCTGCHHYNTSVPILKCADCHNKDRMREDVSIPDLKAAFHRQCMNCHKQWSGENGCNTQCHVRKGESKPQKNEKLLSHPPLTEPGKMQWETNYEQGRIVTFFHDEHNKLFKIDCKTCHRQDNCVKCHDKTRQTESGSKYKKSLSEHHKPCISCHNENNCQKCHRDSEISPFNHGKSAGWTLKSYHSKLACAKCHGNQMPYKKLDRNCTNCHKNFRTGFNHRVTGLVLSDTHKDMDCKSCHANQDFSKPPVCSECHDDKSYPSSRPGKK